MIIYVNSIFGLWDLRQVMPAVSPYTPHKLVSLTKTYTACVLIHLLLRALYLQRNERCLTHLKRFRLTGLILLLSHTWNDPNMKHHMHEKSSPVIFDVVGGAGRWKSSENRGVVEGREVWGSTSALFYCADVALGYCSTVHCSSTFLSLLPLRHFSSLSSLLLSFYFPSSSIIFPSIISPRLMLLAVFSLFVFHLNSVWWDMLGFLYFTVQKFKTINSATKTTSFWFFFFGDWFPCSLNIYKSKNLEQWCGLEMQKRGRNDNPSCEQSSHNA